MMATMMHSIAFWFPDLASSMIATASVRTPDDAGVRRLFSNNKGDCTLDAPAMPWRQRPTPRATQTPATQDLETTVGRTARWRPTEEVDMVAKPVWWSGLATIHATSHSMPLSRARATLTRVAMNTGWFQRGGTGIMRSAADEQIGFHGCPDTFEFAHLGLVLVARKCKHRALFDK